MDQEEKEKKEHLKIRMAMISFTIQRLFWIFGMPYIIISPFLFTHCSKPVVASEPVKIVIALKEDGSPQRLVCSSEDDRYIEVAKFESKNILNSLYSWPQDQPVASARIADISKFIQDNNPTAQSFFSSQLNSVLTESQTSEASFNVSAMKADFDKKSKQYVVAIDGYQTKNRNEVKTTSKLSLDIYYEIVSNKRNTKEDQSEVILQVVKVNVRKGDN